MNLTSFFKTQFKSLKVYFLRRHFVTRLLGWYGLYEFISHGPNRARHIAFLYLFTHRNKKLRERLVNELQSQPECAKIITERKRITTSLDKLANYPDKTLGKVFYLHMHNNNIKLVVPLDAPIKSDFQYIIHRLLITHDIYHTVLGAPTTIYGEGIVASFTYAQIPAYAPPLVHVAAGNLHCSIAQHGLIDRGNLGVVIGWLLGKYAKQLFSIDWDSLWNMPIDEVRKLLQIDIKKIEASVKQFYATDKPWVHTVKNMPMTIEEHLNNGTCEHSTHQITAQANNTAYHYKVACYKPIDQPIKAIAILGRAMFTSGRYLGKMHSPSLTACLLAHGIFVLIPLVNQQQKYPESFDHMVQNTDQFIELAKSLQPNTAIFLIGHSLSGLSYLVNQGLLSAANQVTGVVTLGTSTWNRFNLKNESKMFKLRLHSRAELLRILAFISHYAPARLLRYGDHDEYYQMVQQVTLNNINRGEWKSLDNHFDYYKVIGNTHCAVLSVASNADQYSPPSQVKLFNENLPHAPDVIITDKLRHMDLGASANAWQMWDEVASWIKNKCA